MHAICITCGTQFAASEEPPESCPICDDERQYVGWAGQEWTTLEQLGARHRLALKDEGDGLLGIGAEPNFAIGQRALLVPAAVRGAPGSNVLWDCISLIDRAAIRVVEAQGGLGGDRNLASALLRDRWSSGAGRSAARRSTCTPTIGTG